jgi:K+/H+ antiporter YhaU regulatory subunit KhtT
MPDKNDFSEGIAEMLIKQDRTNELLAKIVDNLTDLKEDMRGVKGEIQGLRKDTLQVKDLSDRIHKLEEIVFKK